MMVLPAFWWEKIWDTILSFMIWSLSCGGGGGMYSSPGYYTWVPTAKEAISIYVLTFVVVIGVGMFNGCRYHTAKENDPTIDFLRKFGVKVAGPSK